MSAANERSKLLASTAAAGVYRLPKGAAEDLAAAAAGLDYRCVRVDLAGRCDKAGLLGRIAEAMAFPSWFGHNWDALADCLTDLEWLPAPGYVLVLEHAAGLLSHAEADFDIAQEIFEQAADFWREQEMPFWVLIDVDASPASARLPELP